jgi:general secretion pathway protein A
MYASHFGFSATPFDLTPNPAYLYLGKQYRDALGAIQYGLADQRGIITLIGEVGTGKTTIIHSLLADLPEGIVATFISYANQPFPSLLSQLLRNLGVLHDPSREPEMLLALETDLRNRAHRKQTVALIIDEAQNLSEEMLDRLRLLSNLESTETKLLQIVLVGQPELGRKLHRHSLRQLNERVSVRAYLKPLLRRELKAYVKHRVQRADGTLNAVSTPLARWLLLRRAWGIPRRVNILFHNAFLYAFGRGARRVTVPVALAAISEMNDRPLRRFLLSLVRRPAWGAAAAAAVLLVALLLNRHVVARTPDAPPLAAVDVPPVAVRVTPPSPPPIAAAPSAETPPPAATPPASAPVAAAPVAPPASTPVVPVPAPVEVAALPERADAPAATPPPADRDPAPPAEQPDPVPTEHPAAVPAEHPAAAPIPCAPIEVRVLPGSSLSSIARDVYGYLPEGAEYARFTSRVKTLNPWITDPNLIFADRTLRVPMDTRPAADVTP